MHVAWLSVGEYRLGAWWLNGQDFFRISWFQLSSVATGTNPKPWGCINFRCRAARSHLWLRRRPKRERGSASFIFLPFLFHFLIPASLSSFLIYFSVVYFLSLRVLCLLLFIPSSLSPPLYICTSTYWPNCAIFSMKNWNFSVLIIKSFWSWNLLTFYQTGKNLNMSWSGDMRHFPQNQAFN